MTRKQLTHLVSPVLIVVIGATISVAGFQVLKHQEVARVRVEIDHAADTYAKFFGNALAAAERELASVAGLFTATGNVSYDQFLTFVRPILKRNAGTWAITWVPRVAARDRPAFERAARSEVSPDYRIREKNDAGQIVPATARADYFPIFYTEAQDQSQNNSAWGVDPLMDPSRRIPFTVALENGTAHATGPITPLGPAFGGEKAIAAVQPIYYNGQAPKSAEARRTALKGYVVELFRISTLVENALAGIRTHGLDIYLYDAAGPEPKLIYYHASRSRSEASSPETEASLLAGSHSIRQLNLEGRPWNVIFKPAPGYFQSDIRLPLIVLIAGLVLSSVLGLYLRSVLEQNARILSKVDIQTKKLAVREARYRQIFETIETGIVAINEQGAIRIFNPAAEKIFGYRSDEVEGQNVGMLMSEADRLHYHQHLRSYLGAGVKKMTGIGQDVTAVRKNGEEFPAHIGVGEITGTHLKNYIATVTDTTAAKRNNMLLEGQARIMSLIAAGQPLGVILGTLCRMTESALPGMRCSVLLLDVPAGCLRHGAAPSMPDFYNDAIDGIAIGPESGSCGSAAFSRERVVVEDVLTHPFWTDYKELAGKSGFLACWSQPFFSDAGEVLGTLALYLDERRKPAQPEIDLILKQASLATIAVENTRAKQQLIDSERRFRQIAETIEEVFWVVSPDWTEVLYVSTAYEKVWGRSVQSLLDKPMSWMEAVHPDDRQAMQAALEAAVNGARRHAAECRIVWPDESIHWVRAQTYPVCDEQGKIVRTVGLTEDITEYKLLAGQYRQSQKMEAVGQLTGGVAHDFNNLLAVIEGNLSLLEGELSEHKELPSEQALEFVKPAIEAGRRGADLTHRLLAFARKQVLRPRALDIGKIVSGMSDLLKRTLREDIDLSFHLASETWLAEVDASELENVLLNLAINARDAMPNGGSLTIETAEVSLDEAYATTHEDVSPGDYVLLAASDTGGGMDADTLERAFEPFFTTKEVGTGTGLGLSMVYGFARQSGGHAAIYSEPGQGTTVRLYLPRTTTEDAVTAHSPIDPDNSPTGGDETILVVEDDAAVRRITTRILRRQGYTVLEAEDAHAALDILHNGHSISLLLTDVVLAGGMNGPELVRTVAEEAQQLKVLYMSGYTENAVLHHGRLDAGVHLIGKPFSHAELGAKVREILDSGR